MTATNENVVISYSIFEQIFISAFGGAEDLIKRGADDQKRRQLRCRAINNLWKALLRFQGGDVMTLASSFEDAIAGNVINSLSDPLVWPSIEQSAPENQSAKFPSHDLWMVALIRAKRAARLAEDKLHDAIIAVETARTNVLDVRERKPYLSDCL